MIIINNLDCPKQSIAEYTHLLEKKNIVIYLESGEYYSEEFLEYFEADEKEIQYMNDIIGFQFRQSKNLRVTSLSGINSVDSKSPSKSKDNEGFLLSTHLFIMADVPIFLKSTSELDI